MVLIISTANYTHKCGLNYYESSNGICSSVGVGYYSPNLDNNEYICSISTPSIYGCYTYNWYTGIWGSCNANPYWGSRSSCNRSCGGGTQYRTCYGTSGNKYRTVKCKRSDGIYVSDLYCTGTKPSNSQSCSKYCTGSNSRSCNTHSCCVSNMGNSCVIDIRYTGCVPDFSFYGWPGYTDYECYHSCGPIYYSNCKGTKYGTIDCNGNCR